MASDGRGREGSKEGIEPRKRDAITSVRMLLAGTTFARRGGRTEAMEKNAIAPAMTRLPPYLSARRPPSS